MLNVSSAVLGTLLLGQILSSGPFLVPLTRSRSTSSSVSASSVAASEATASSPAKASSASIASSASATSRSSSSRKALPVLTAPKKTTVAPVSQPPPKTVPPTATPTNVVAPSSTPSTAKPATPVIAPILSDLEKKRADVLRLVNAERSLIGVTTLKQNALLEQAAQEHAEDMAARNYFSHISPEGKTPLDRIKAKGYFSAPCTGCLFTSTYAENTGADQRTPEEIVDAWMHSDSHRKNILDPSFADTGIGFAKGYWVETFGSVNKK
jgi:uncharacterized protein YkwD